MENKEPLIEEINKITNNEYNFMLKSATFDEMADFCVIEIFYKDGILIDKTLKEKVETKIYELLPKSIKYEIKFIKNFVGEEQITLEIKKFMENDFSSIAFRIDKVKLNNLEFDIDMKFDILSFEYAKQKNVNLQIEKHLKNIHSEYNFKINYESDIIAVIDEKKQLIESYREEVVDISKFRKIDFFDAVPIVNNEILGPASYIVDKKTVDEEVTFCGKIKSIKSIEIEVKSKKQESNTSDNKSADDSSAETKNIEEDEKKLNIDNGKSYNNVENADVKKSFRTIFRWTLVDITESITCSIMANKENKQKLEDLKENTTIAVHGKLGVSKMTGSLVCYVHDISLCSIPDNLQEYIIYKKEKPFYEFVEPEKIVVYQQDSLMNYCDEKIIPKYLKNKVFVCYDLETTGLHYVAGDRMVEIGAVKIVNGKITEKFVSYVNPNGKHIDEEASKTTGIYDDDVKDALKDYQVIQDFYKFTRGAIIIGYNNINFDNVFLLGQAKSCRWNFDNETEDVFKLAQKYVLNVKNYKLSTIASKLNVVLDNAHSAYYDALATAEVFLKIAEMIN